MSRQVTPSDRSDRRPKPKAAAFALFASIALSACGSSVSGGSAGSGGSGSCGNAKAALDALSTKVVGSGPNGETPVPASQVKLTDAEIQQIKDKHATAAIVMHYGGNDWSTAQVDGQKAEFAALGIKVIAVTDAQFKPEKQVSDIETVLAQHPNIIVSIPTDPVATADAYRKASAAGVKLVFIGNVPKGFSGQDGYVSVVGSDDAGNGVAAGHLLAQSLNCRGKVGLIYHNADFFVTRQRYQAVKKTLADHYPNIQIVDEKGIGGPDFTGDAEQAATAMLTKHPNLDGIWAVWDVPAEGVLAAARSAGRKDLIVTTCDLGLNVAVEMAKGGLVKGLGAQLPYDQGTTEAMLAGYALLGKAAPAAVDLQALPVTKSNVLAAWKQVYHADPPADLTNAAK